MSDAEFTQISTELAAVNQEIAKCFTQLSTTVCGYSHAASNLMMVRVVRRRSELQGRISFYLFGL